MDKRIEQIIEGNNIEVLETFPDNYIDSIVTDPPYELGFMGKKWDSTGIAYNVDLWRECLRVLKPGGHLIAFSGSRTYHRMAVAIEDAGFEIRDQIMWVYGSGFPKSHDISKAIDKMAGAEREVVGTKDLKRGSPIAKQTTETSITGWNKENYSSVIDITAPATEQAKQWEGWGTALKPAHEPMVLARKPMSESTIAENVLKWGTGAINIDGCRIGEKIKYIQGVGGKNTYSGGWKNEIKEKEVDGRFPANFILDEEASKILDEQSGVSKSTHSLRKKSGANVGNGTTLNDYKIVNDNYGGFNDKGGASRFFYVPKASNRDRNSAWNGQEIGLEEKPNLQV